MPVLLDTNILIRLVQPNHSHARFAARALKTLRLRSELLYITQQNIVEFWAVATRPIVANGLGFSTEHALLEVNALQQFFTLLPETPLHAAWERLVVDYRVSGKNTHDARMVAAMVVHGIDSILTFNVQDFARYKNITTLDPTVVT